MAETFDGSVKINTQLDNSGFDKGSKELAAAIRELSAEVKAMGATLKNAFDGYAKAVQTAVSANGGMQQSTAVTDDKVQELKSDIDEIKTAVTQLKAAGSEQAVTFNQPKKQTSELTSSITTLQRQVNSLPAVAQKAAEGNEAATAKLRTGYRSATDRLQELKKELDEVGKQKIPTEHFQWLTKEIEKANQAVGRFLDKQEKMKAMGVSPDSKAYRANEYELKNANAWYNDKVNEREGMLSDGTAYTTRSQTQLFQDEQTKLAQIEQQLERIRAIAPRAFQSIFASLAKKVGSGLLTTLKSVTTNAMKAATALGKMAAKGLASGISKVGSAIASIGRHSKSSRKGLAGGLKMLIRYGLGVRSVYVLINKMRRALMASFKSLAQYDPEFNGVMSSFIGSLKQLSNAFAAAFAPVLQAVLPALTAFINGISEGVNRLGALISALMGKASFTKATKVQYDYAAAQNSTASSASKATGALNKEAKAAKKVKTNLMGFDQVNILSKDDEDSDSGSGSGFASSPFDSQTAGFADALSEMWKKADFTQLGKMLGEKIKAGLGAIPWAKIKKSLSKVAKSIATFLNGFLEVPGLFAAIGTTIAEALNSAFTYVDSFVTSFHWASLGKAIRDGVVSFCQGIDWSLVFHTLSTLGKGLATTLNESLGDPEIWTNAMTVLSNGLNAIVLGASQFLQTLDWGSIGLGIAAGLNTAIATINWTEISTMLISGFNGVFDLWFNFVTTFDFWSFGNSIGTSLSNAIVGINWGEGGFSVGQTITGLFDTLNGFIAGVNWSALGRSVIDAIAGFFLGFEWSSVGEYISGCFRSLLEFLNGAMSEINWGEVGDYILGAIADFFTSFDWAGVCEEVGKLIANAFKAVFDLGGWAISKIIEACGNIAQGGLQGILDGFANIGRWIVDNIFDPFIQGFKDAFGINSPSREMAKMGGYLISGLYQGLKDKIDGVGNWIRQNIFDPFINGFKSLFGINSPSTVMAEQGGYLIAGLKNGCSDAFYMITDFFSGIGSAISNTVSELGSWWSGIGSDIVAGIQNGLDGSWDNVINSCMNWCGNLWDNIVDFFGIGSPSKLMRDTVGRWIPAGVAVGIDQAADTAVQSVTSMAQAISDEAAESSAIMPIETSFGQAASGLDGVLNVFSDKVVSGFQAMISALNALVSDVSFGLPAMATGSITPYSVSSGRSGSNAQDVAEALSASDSSITREELRDLLIDLGQKIEGISFYIGDENIARHANKGNIRLNQRFKTTG